MKIAYLDCFSGVSGDMCLGALVDAGVPVDAIREALRRLPFSGYALEAEKVTRAGIAATHVRITLDQSPHPEHRRLSDVLESIRAGKLPKAVQEKACQVFRNLAEAEALVHDSDPESVRFHEVGAVDAICDVVGMVAALEWLGIQELLFSTISLGGGSVRTAEGMLPVPAPATAELLRGLPTAGGPVEFELATPTGAALLKTLGRPSPRWPAMRVERIGYGAGSREVPGMPNVLRVAVGEAGSGAETESDLVWTLEVNLDDMTAEEIGFCTERLRESGALDAFTTPIQMKKGRPAVKLTVLCAPGELEAMERALWRHSTTLGIRRSLWQRSKLRRRSETVPTPWGKVRVKLAYLGEELLRCEPEYEDCRRLAEREGLPLREVYRAARSAWEHSP